MLVRLAGIGCVAVLAGCASPRVSVTDATSDGISFLVQDALLIPRETVDAQAAMHCQEHDLTYRRTEAVWTSRTSLRMAYECVRSESVRARKPEAPRRTPAPAPQAVADAAKPAPADPRTAAWEKAKVATDAWALCLRFGAQRLARETRDPAQVVAQAAVDACAALERAVHDPLNAVGQDSRRFQADLHTQALQNAKGTVVQTRMEANAQGAAVEAKAHPVEN